MSNSQATPDSTAVRVALWRALHVELDAKPPVLEDTLGLRLVAPDANWRERPDMNPQFTRRLRASMVARARVIEDLVAEQAARGVAQYVLLGAGLDTFAQRRPEIAARLRIFEVDRPGSQAWKKQRLAECGIAIPESLRFVPVDFEKGGSWSAELAKAGFDPRQPAVIASTGVSLYLTKETNAATLREVAALAPGSVFALSFILPIELVDAEERPGVEIAIRGARASGTPFVSFFSPAEIIEMARAAGFQKVEHVSAASLEERYFAGRSDGLRPSSGEELIVAST